jgi:hypothetical protein
VIHKTKVVNFPLILTSNSGKKKKRKKKLSLTFYLLSAGIPDFAEVYSFIGSVFDPDTKGHVEKLQEMDPINFETVS